MNEELSIPTKIHNDLAKFIEQKGKKQPNGHYTLILEYCPHTKKIAYEKEFDK